MEHNDGYFIIRNASVSSADFFVAIKDELSEGNLFMDAEYFRVIGTIRQAGRTDIIMYACPHIRQQLEESLVIYIRERAYIIQKIRTE